MERAAASPPKQNGSSKVMWQPQHEERNTRTTHVRQCELVLQEPPPPISRLSVATAATSMILPQAALLYITTHRCIHDGLLWSETIFVSFQGVSALSKAPGPRAKSHRLFLWLLQKNAATDTTYRWLAIHPLYRTAWWLTWREEKKEKDPRIKPRVSFVPIWIKSRLLLRGHLEQPYPQPHWLLFLDSKGSNLVVGWVDVQTGVVIRPGVSFIYV